MLREDSVVMNFYNKVGTMGMADYQNYICLLYTSDAADERSSVDLGGRRIIKKKKKENKCEKKIRYTYKANITRRHDIVLITDKKQGAE